MQAEAPLFGDLLETVLSRLSLLDLLPASYVSKTWQRTVSSALRSPTRAKPWLVLHMQSPRDPSATATHAYDPHSRTWIQIPHVHNQHASILRRSHSNHLYIPTLSKLSISCDALNATWTDITAPHVWRVDPIVAVVGAHVVVAGGTCDFEADPLAVEAYEAASGTWRTCQPMPALFKNSASATWLSIAASDTKMYVLEKDTGGFCSFDLDTMTWGPTSNLRPDPSVFFSTVHFSGHRLIVVGLVGHAGDVRSLGIWEVECESRECREIGKMPSDMLKKLMSEEDSRLPSIGVSTAGDYAYIYNPSYPKEIIGCDFSAGNCEWASIPNSVVDDRNRMRRLTFTCSTVGIDDIREAFRSRSRKLPEDPAGNWQRVGSCVYAPLL